MTARSLSATPTKRASSISSLPNVVNEHASSVRAKQHHTNKNSTIKEMYEEKMPELELDSGCFVYIERGPKARRISYTLRQLRHTLGRTQQELAASA